MAFPTEHSTFGASIVPTSQQPAENVLRPPPASESPALTPMASREDMPSDHLVKPVPPHSPFHQHPPASFEKVHSRQASKTNVATYEKDLESGNATPLTGVNDENPFTSKISVDCNKECKMWPSRQTIIQSKMAEKRRRRDRKCCAGCGPVRDFWAQFDKRQKLLIKLAIGLFLVGIIVAIGVGISKAVHGTYYSQNGSQQEVGSHNGSGN